MKKPKHYRERNRIMINYFKMPVGYLIAWDRQHNTTKVSEYGDRKQPPAKNTHKAAHSNGNGLCMWHMKPALKPSSFDFPTSALLQNLSIFEF